MVHILMCSKACAIQAKVNEIQVASDRCVTIILIEGVNRVIQGLRTAPQRA